MRALKQWWASMPQTRQATLGVGALAVMLAVIVGASVPGQDAPPVRVVGTSTIVAAPPPAGVEIPLPSLSPTAVGLTTLTTLKELRDRFGDPPDAKRGRIRIPSLGVDAPLGIRGVPVSGQMPAPAGPSDVILYDFSQSPGWGGMPGGGGNAIVSGHVDYSYKLPYVEANYHGPAVFRGLSLVSAGDVIEMTVDGRVYSYTVQWRRVTLAVGPAWGDLLAHDIGREAITLITCEGNFNPATQEYDSRTVVRAVRT